MCACVCVRLRYAEDCVSMISHLGGTDDSSTGPPDPLVLVGTIFNPLAAAHLLRNDRWWLRHHRAH